jgi:hypothetical protein
LKTFSQPIVVDRVHKCYRVIKIIDDQFDLSRPMYRQVIELFVGHCDALTLIAHPRKRSFGFHTCIVKCHSPHQPHRLLTLSTYGFQRRPYLIVINIQKLGFDFFIHRLIIEQLHIVTIFIDHRRFHV